MSYAPLDKLLYFRAVIDFLYATDEDRKNKPHRPIVSGACTLEEAKKVFVIGAFIFLVTAYCLGVFPYAAWWVAEVVVVSEWVHNGWWKNFYSAFGFYLMLAASWLLGGQTFEKSFLLPFSTSALHIFSLPLKVFLTVWVQDFRDIEGDVAHERITTPVVFGEQKARYIMLWLFAVACPFLIFVTLMSPDVALTKVIFVTACMSAALIWLGVVLLYSTSRQTDDWLYHSYIKWFGALILLRLALKLI